MACSTPFWSISWTSLSTGWNQASDAWQWLSTVGMPATVPNGYNRGRDLPRPRTHQPAPGYRHDRRMGYLDRALHLRRVRLAAGRRGSGRAAADLAPMAAQ